MQMQVLLILGASLGMTTILGQGGKTVISTKFAPGIAAHASHPSFQSRFLASPTLSPLPPSVSQQRLAQAPTCVRCNDQGVCHECNRGQASLITTSALTPTLMPRGNLANPRPQFCLPSLPTLDTATTYRVRINQGSKTVMDRSFTLEHGTDSDSDYLTIPYPDDLPSLAWDQDYRLTVQTEDWHQEVPLFMVSAAIFEQLERDIEAIRQDQTSDLQAQLGIAQLYQDAGLYSEAIEQLEQLEASQRNAKSYQQLADLYLQLSQAPQAFAAYERAIALSLTHNHSTTDDPTPDLATHDFRIQLKARFGQARAQIALGQLDAAIVALEQLDHTIGQLNPVHDSLGRDYQELAAEAASILGQLHKFARRYDSAKLWYDRAYNDYQQLQDQRHIWIEEELLELTDLQN